MEKTKLIVEEKKSEQPELKTESEEKEEIIDEIIQDVIKVAKVEDKNIQKEGMKEEIEKWSPKTKLGKMVKAGKIKHIDEILDNNTKILEPEIVSHLLRLKADLVNIGQSKGKFGGGKRRVWKQTQKKTKEGNVAKFSSMAIVGNEDGYVGVGYGSAKETLPSRVKAERNARLDIIKIRRGCGSFDCSCNNPHSIVSKVEGKCGSVRLVLYPAPQGTGLVVGDECKKMLRLAGIKDVYSKRFGQSRTTINLIKACLNALEKTRS